MISVIINCNNCLEHLEKALTSVLSQTEQNWEVIFWDNASDTPALDALNKFNDPRVKYFYNREFVSLGQARNQALLHAHGDFIAFLDADDFWMPQKLERQLETFLSTPRAGLVYTDAAIVFGDKQIKQIFSQKRPPEGKVFGGSQKMVKLGVLEDAYISIARRQIKNIKQKYVIDKNLTAPINQGDSVGYVVIKLDNKILTTIKLHSMESIGEGSFYQKTLDSILRSF